MSRGVAIGAAAVAAVVGPVVLVLALIGGLTVAVLGAMAGTTPTVDPTRVPPLARELLPRITDLTTRRCPELPPVWVVAEVAAESGWNPGAFSRDRNGGAAGLYQINQTNWITAGGQPWVSTPPPAGADILDPARYLDLAVPFVCANLRTATDHLRRTGKPTAPLDAMLVCHIAGCGRVTGSATGIPQAGEAGCDAHCADLVARYIANVHHFLAAYTTATAPEVGDLPAPTPFTGPDGGCTLPDPTSRGCLTPATRHALDQVLAVFGPPGPVRPLRSVACWDLHPQNPRSDHRIGRACDFFPTAAGHFPAGAELADGWRLAAWLRANAAELHVSYVIWQGRIWSPDTADQDGWGRPYTGGGVYDPTDVTGGHFDHVHLSIAQPS